MKPLTKSLLQLTVLGLVFAIPLTYIVSSLADARDSDQARVDRLKVEITACIKAGLQFKKLDNVDALKYGYINPPTTESQMKVQCQRSINTVALTQTFNEGIAQYTEIK
jgi:hypothetical protein